MTLFQIKSGHYDNNYIFSIGSDIRGEGYQHEIGRYQKSWTKNKYINVLKEL